MVMNPMLESKKSPETNARKFGRQFLPPAVIYHGILMPGLVFCNLRVARVA